MRSSIAESTWCTVTRHITRARIELYRGKPILYGCGDLVTDYEGIGGHEAFRGDLGLMYFASFERGDLTELRMSADARPEDAPRACLAIRRQSG